MAANIMDEIFKHFPDLEDGWKEMEEKLKTEPAEREMLSLKYRERLEREILKENLPEPEFTKAKRAESDSKVMKANAPEKIYLQVCGDCPQTDCESCKFEDLEDNVTWAKERIFEKDVEYTRTDAFIEKAAEWIKNKAEKYIVDTPLCSYFDYKRAVEDFKNHIKGE